MLNNPLIGRTKVNQGGSIPSEYSFVKTDAPNVIIESIKKSEDGNAVVVRMYECYNRRTTTKVTFASKLGKAWETDMLENKQKEVRIGKGHTLCLEMKPYEIKTIEIKLDD
jgi:alpha-mannosidase